MRYPSNYKKAGVVLLVILLVLGLFATMSLAQNNGNAGGKNGFSKGDISVAEPCSGRGGYRQDAPDDDGDGIPNGLDDDYIADCDCECCVADDDGDGIPNCQDEDYEGDCACAGEPKGHQWGKQ